MVKIKDYPSKVYPFEVRVTKGRQLIYSSVFPSLEAARDNAMGRFGKIDKEEVSCSTR